MTCSFHSSSWMLQFNHTVSALHSLLRSFNTHTATWWMACSIVSDCEWCQRPFWNPMQQCTTKDIHPDQKEKQNVLKDQGSALNTLSPPEVSLVTKRSVNMRFLLRNDYQTDNKSPVYFWLLAVALALKIKIHEVTLPLHLLCLLRQQGSFSVAG